MSGRPESKLLLDFGRAVRTLREARKWSQEEFADRIGIHRTYIGDVERGERNIGLINCGRIASALDINLSALMVEMERHGDT